MESSSSNNCLFCGIPLSKRSKKFCCLQHKQYFHRYKDKYPVFNKEIVTEILEKKKIYPGRLPLPEDEVKVLIQLPVDELAQKAIAKIKKFPDYFREELNLFLLRDPKEIAEIIQMHVSKYSIEDMQFKNHSIFISKNLNALLHNKEKELLRSRRNLLIIFGLYLLRE